jgi:fluoride exporter
LSGTWTLAQAALVAVGAAAGGVARWAVGVALAGQGPGFPAATLAVNVLGGFCIGVALAVFARHPHEALRLLLITGFLGGFTTFSAFSAESLQLMQRAAYGLAAAHTAAHTLLALAAAAAGHRLFSAG